MQQIVISMYSYIWYKLTVCQTLPTDIDLVKDSRNRVVVKVVQHIKDLFLIVLKKHRMLTCIICVAFNDEMWSVMTMSM